MRCRARSFFGRLCHAARSLSFMVGFPPGHTLAAGTSGATFETDPVSSVGALLPCFAALRFSRHAWAML